MANMSVDSAAFAKLTSALQGQSVALNKLTSELGADNKREFLQKAKPITIQSVQTRQGMRPFDTAIADAMSRAQTSAPKVTVERQKEEGLLSKIAKGIVGIGAIAIIFKAIQNNPALKKAFNDTVATIKGFFFGKDGIITKALGFLTDGEGGKFLDNMSTSLKDMFKEGSFLDKLATTGVEVIKTIFSAIKSLIDYVEHPETLYKDITTLIGTMFTHVGKILGDSLRKTDIGAIFGVTTGQGGEGGSSIGGLIGILTGEKTATETARKQINTIFALINRRKRLLFTSAEEDIDAFDKFITPKLEALKKLVPGMGDTAGMDLKGIIAVIGKIGSITAVATQKELQNTLTKLNTFIDKLPGVPKIVHDIADAAHRLERSFTAIMSRPSFNKMVDLFHNDTKSKNLQNILTIATRLIGTLSPAMKTMALKSLLPAAATGTATPGGAGATGIIAPITNLDNTIKTLKTAIDNLSSKIDAMKTAAFDPGGSNGGGGPSDPNTGWPIRDRARTMAA